MFEFTLYRNASDIHQSKECISNPNIPGLFPVLTPEELLESHVQYIKMIDELAGVSKNHFDRFYREAINNFVRFVQQLPASEGHHHADHGGMLAHGLEVCVNALKISQSFCYLPTAGLKRLPENRIYEPLPYLRVFYVMIWPNRLLIRRFNFC